MSLPSNQSRSTPTQCVPDDSAGAEPDSKMVRAQNVEFELMRAKLPLWIAESGNCLLIFLSTLRLDRPTHNSMSFTDAMDEVNEWMTHTGHIGGLARNGGN